jgi:hypothetical protein
LHTPLRESNNPNKGKWLTPPGETDPVWWELADLRNDFFVKMEGNFTSGSAKHTENDLRTFHKFFGRGANKWGTCINLEHNCNNGLFYNLVEGEEYTFYLKDRSNTAIVDYIVFYDTSYLAHNINNQGPDLAIQLPEELRPYAIPTAMAFNSNKIDLRVGTSLQLETIMTPTNANPNATWSSSDDAIVSVDENGIITAKGSIADKVTITAVNKFDNSLIATTEITLVAFFKEPVTSVTVNPNQINIVEGESDQLSVTVLPETADDRSVTWSSSDDAIATVDQNGMVTGISTGSVKITATSNDNNTIFGEADVVIEEAIPMSVSINKINGMSIADFKTARSNKIEIDEVLEMEISHSNITEFGGTGFGRVVIRYAINNGGKAVGPNLNIDNVALGAAEVTETVNYTVADHNTGNSSETAVLQIFAAQNFGGINSLYAGFEVVPSGTLSIKKELLNQAIQLYPNPAENYFMINTSANVSNLKAQIFDMSGKLVYSKLVSHRQISTDAFKSGVYIVKLQADHITIHRKLIIK